MNPPNGSDIYIGLMSGTSLDGVDIAIVDFSGQSLSTLYTGTTAYPAELRQRLRQLTRSQTTTLDDFYRLDAELSEIYAGVVGDALDAVALTPDSIAALGCHGQTIRHRPDASPAYTAQIGDPGRLAILTGIRTVADFRRKDVALGGQGAPLAPAFHRFLLRSEDENRAVVNIGGIANVTILPANTHEPTLGFDTGPGNTFLDFWIEENRDERFDGNGDWARGGKIIADLLQNLLNNESYFRLPPPKSTGTEYFNPDWLRPQLSGDQSAQNVQATLLELSASTIATAIRDLSIGIDRCFVCGGGAHNGFLLERLEARLDGIPVATTQTLGIDPDFVEASAFAWLARCRIQEKPVDLTEITGASRNTILGAVYTQ